MTYEILQGQHFQKAMKRMSGDAAVLENVQKRLADIAAAEFTPGMDLSRVGNDPGRPLYKIRLNESDRLIFEGPLRVDGVESPVLFVHEFGRHDDISTMIRRALRRDLSTADLSELIVTSINEDPVRIQSNGLNYRIPWPAYLDSNNFNVLMENLSASLLLTTSQQAALKAPYPVLIQGQAGSGKSAVLSHHLAMHIDEDSRRSAALPRLYVSYNKRLVDRAKSDVAAIVQAGYGLDCVSGSIRFLSYRDLLRELIPDPSDRFEDRHHVSWIRFRDGFCARRTMQVSPELAWHAIRSFFKGSCLPPHRFPLDTAEYKRRGRRAQELLDEGQIDRLFDLSRRYVDWLRSERLWDDLDLAWHALQWLLNNDDGPRYAEIYCDEGQDLTELDLTLLILLSDVQWEGNRPRIGLILAADPLQTIHPSGFRWAMVKDRIFAAVKTQHKVETSVQLNVLAENWRSDAAIVHLANAVQQLRSRFTDELIPAQAARRDDENPPSLASISGELPAWLFETVLKKVPPKTGIIVREEDDKKELLELGVPPSDLYTVMDAKGLEFDVAVLWRPAEGDDQWWSLLLSGVTAVSENQKVPVLYMLNRLYVAVTRSVEGLFIFETDETIQQRWLPLFQDKVIRYRLDELEHNTTLTRKGERFEWEQWARTLEDREEYDRAAKSYDQARQKVRANRCRAKAHRIRGEYAEAAALFLATEDFLEAAQSYFDAALWQEAFEAAERSPEGVPPKRLAARAFYNWQSRAGNSREAVRLLLHMIETRVERDYQWIRNAAQTLKELQLFQKAGELFILTGDYEAAGQCFAESSEWEEALSAFLKVGAENSSRYRAEGEVEARSGNLAKAIDSFRRARSWQRMLDCCQKIGDVAGQIEALRKLGRYQEAITAIDAALISETSNDKKSDLQGILQECAALAGNWSRAQRVAEDLGNWFEAVRCAERAGESQSKIHSLRARGLLEQRDYLGAAKLFDELGDRIEASCARAKYGLARKEFNDAAAEFGAMLYIRSFFKTHMEAIRHRSPLESRPEELAAQTVFRFLSELDDAQLSELKQKAHTDDRREIERLRKQFPDALAEVWRRCGASKQATLLKLVPLDGIPSELDVDPLEFVAAALERVGATLDRAEQNRLIEALEEIEARPYPWEKRFSPRQMGQAWALTGNHLKTAKWYEGLFAEGLEEAWVIEEAIQARERQRDRVGPNEPEAIERINRIISRHQRTLKTLQTGKP